MSEQDANAMHTMRDEPRNDCASAGGTGEGAQGRRRVRYRDVFCLG